VTGHDDSRARLYESSTGGWRGNLEGASAPIQSIAHSPDGTRIAAGTADGSVIVWDVATGDSSAILGGNPQGLAASCVRWSPDGARLAISLGGDSLDTEQATLVICSADRGEIKGQFGLDSSVGAIDWMPSGQALVIADYNGQGTIRNVSNGLVLSTVTLRGGKDAVSAAQWSPNCSLVEQLDGR
jgi:WD40 repeat protein